MVCSEKPPIERVTFEQRSGGSYGGFWWKDIPSIGNSLCKSLCGWSGVSKGERGGDGVGYTGPLGGFGLFS